MASPSEKRSSPGRVLPREQYQRRGESKLRISTLSPGQTNEHRSNRSDAIIRRFDRDRFNVRDSLRPARFITPPAAGWRRRSQEEGHARERPLRHVQHLDHVPPSRSSHVRRLFRFPSDDARGQEQKEAREEHREEYEQVDVELVLTEEHHSVTGYRRRHVVGRQGL